MHYLKYPRVTSIIEKTEDTEKKKNLLRWRKKLEKVHGVEGAEEERQRILQRGTGTHTAIEKFLADKVGFDNGIDISPMHSILNCIKQQSDLLIIENRVYCHEYQFQGKADLICNYNGLTTVFDWTTSTALKQRAWIDHKFIQAGAYALAYESLGLLKIEQLAVVVLIASERKPQLFIEDDVHAYKEIFKRRLIEYKALSSEEAAI